MQIFLSRSHPAPDMPLRLVRIQHLAGFTGKGRIDLEEPFGDILMYRTLTDPKLLRRLPHSRVIFYNIISNLHGSFLNIIFQKNPPAYILFTMYAGGRKVMPCLVISNPDHAISGIHPDFLLSSAGSAIISVPLQRVKNFMILHLYTPTHKGLG